MRRKKKGVRVHSVRSDLAKDEGGEEDEEEELSEDVEDDDDGCVLSLPRSFYIYGKQWTLTRDSCSVDSKDGS